MAQWTRPDRKHSIETVKQIITADPSETVAGLAAELGMNKQTLRDIREGRTYRDVMPEVERTPFWDRQHGCCKCRFYTPREDRHVKAPWSIARCQQDNDRFLHEALIHGGRPHMVGTTCRLFQPKPSDWL